MQTTEWLAYFERNAGRASPDTPESLEPLPEALRVPLIHALQCFQLGEAGEGRIANQARASNDPALDDNPGQGTRHLRGPNRENRGSAASQPGSDE